MSDKIFLATTALSDFWEKDRPILFLGKWCLLYNKKEEWSDLSYELIDDIWKKSENLYKASIYCDGLYEKFLPSLSDIMNEIHNETHNVEYWRIILGPWFLYFVNILYDRYLCLRKAFKKFPELTTTVLSENCYVTPFDFSEFRNNSVRDYYNLQLYSQIINLMGYSMPEKEYHPLDDVIEKHINKNRSSLKQLKLLLIQLGQLCNSITIRKFSILSYNLYLPYFTLLKMMYYSKMRIVPLFPIKLFNQKDFHLNKAARSKISSIQISKKKDDFQRILVESLAVNLPIIYLEGYSELKNLVLQKLKKNPKAIVSATGWVHDESFKIFSANKNEKGTKLICFQHGGLYGVELFDNAEDHEYKICDLFISWGWNCPNNAKIIPLPNPNPKFSKPLKKKIIKNGHILFSSANFPRYCDQLRSLPVGPGVETYIEWDHRFVSALSDKVHEQAIFRLYPYEYGWYHREQLRNAFPKIELDNYSLSFSKMLRKSRLFICSDNQTTFLESFGINIPTIMFINPRQWKIKENVKPYYNQLERVGILFYSPEEAARKVNSVFENPLSWWNSAEVQSVRSEFLSMFSLSTKSSIKDWANGLLKRI